MIDLLYPPVTPEATEERRRRWQVSLIGQHPGHEFRKGAAGDRKAAVPNRKNDARRVPLPICPGLRYKASMKTTSYLLLTFLAVALPAHGQAYKCRQPDGSTQISSEPCAGGARTLREVDEDVVSPEARARAERDAERARQRADRLEGERRADEAAERKERERQRKESGLPSEAAIQQCLNTLGRMNLDSSRRGEMENGCYATGKIEPVYTETYQQPYYGGYYPAYPYPPRPPRPPHPPPADRPAAKPVDLYKVPATPRGSTR